MARARLPEPEHPDVLVMAHLSEHLTTVADPYGAIILSALYFTGKKAMCIRTFKDVSQGPTSC